MSAEGCTNLWYVIAAANGLEGEGVLVAGTSLTVPEVKTSSNDANTFKPYNLGEITGPTSPGLPYIAPPDNGCGTVGLIIMAAVAVIVTAYTAGALSGLVGAGMGTLTTGSAIAVGAIAGAAGSAAGLAVGSMMGVASFNWSGVAAGAVTGAITGGLAAQFGSVGSAVNGTTKAGLAVAPNALKAAGLALANGAAGYAGQKLAGTGASFSWRSIAASAVSSLVTGKYASKVENALKLETDLARDFSYGMTGGMVSAAVRSSFGQTLHRSDYATIVGDAIGGTLMGALSRQSSTAPAQAPSLGRTASGDWDPKYLLASVDGGGVPAMSLPDDIRAAAERPEPMPAIVDLPAVTAELDPALREELAIERRHAAWLRAGDRPQSNAINFGAFSEPPPVPAPSRQTYAATPVRAPVPMKADAVVLEAIKPASGLGATLLQGYMSIQDQQLLALKDGMSWVRERSRGMVEDAQSPGAAGLGATLYAINSVTEGVVAGLVDSARLVTNGQERSQFVQSMGVLLTTNPLTTASAAWGHWSQMSDEQRYIAGAVGLLSLPRGVTSASVLADALPVGSPAKLARPINSAADTAGGVPNSTLYGRFASADELGAEAFTRYQRYTDEAYSATLRAEARGRLAIPEGMSRETIIGQRTDAIARARMSRWLQNEGIAEGPGQIVQLNRWLRDPSGSGLYRIPDVRIPNANLIMDGTIGFKWQTTPQVADFYEFSGGSNIMIVRPTQLGGSYSLLPPW